MGVLTPSEFIVYSAFVDERNTSRDHSAAIRRAAERCGVTERRVADVQRQVIHLRAKGLMKW